MTQTRTLPGGIRLPWRSSLALAVCLVAGAYSLAQVPHWWRDSSGWRFLIHIRDHPSRIAGCIIMASLALRPWKYPKSDLSSDL